MNIRQTIIRPLKAVFVTLAVLWIIFFLASIFPELKNMGIYPRTIHGLIGILTSPFIHADLSHLIANSTGILILGTVFASLEGSRFKYIIVPIFLLSGLGTWLIGRSGSVHIGASGVIYGLLGYLLFAGIFTKKLSTIAVSILVLFLYGGAVWGIFPLIGQPYISWEAHLSGFIAGIITAWSEAGMKIRLFKN
jgi:membrane associated rhomboid family serine protease